MEKVKFALFLMGCCILAGCGYHFVTQPTLPAGLQTIHVRLLANDTGLPGIETIFTNDIIYEIIRAEPSLLADHGVAEGSLGGAVTKVRYSTVAQQSAQVSLQRLVICTLELNLTDRHGVVVWSARNLSDSESFFVVADNKLATEENQKEAIRRLSRRLAEKIYYRLTENF
jgi:outer membrane lipopolysaccharide assembly protein LptE/RlpB